jgi:hypothetical protein
MRCTNPAHEALHYAILSILLFEREERSNLCRPLGRKPEVKRPLGRPKREWEDNIRMVER